MSVPAVRVIVAKVYDFNTATKLNSQLVKALMNTGQLVAVIGDLIVGIENRDGNANVRFHQQDTLERIFSNLESNDIHIKRARMDCGSCSREIVETVEKHSEHFYIRANRCGSLYDSLLALRGWKREEINGIEYEVNSILTEKWEGKTYRLVIQRERRMARNASSTT